MKRPFSTLLGALLFAGLSQANAATLQIDFDISFGDPTDPNTAPPGGPSPWLTAFFDDHDSTGSVTLTLSVANVASVGAAEVTAVYLNVDDAIGGANLTITPTGGTGPAASISAGTDIAQAADSGSYDILFDLPPPGGDRFTAGETLIYNITANNLVASSFNFLSTPDLSGPFLGAAKFQSTSGCATGAGQCSDWVGAVPVPAAVWLFGTGLLGLIGVVRRKKV